MANGVRAAARRADIEGLRAVAVGLVVIYHAGVWGFAGGYVGVDVFFVISGFLITGLLVGELDRDGSLSFIGFYGRRARRLLPMATIVLATTAFAFSFVVSPIDRHALESSIRASAAYVANWHFAFAAFSYGSPTSVNPVLHYWSLSIEEQFYLAWPMILWLVTRRLRRRHRVVALQRPGSGGKVAPTNRLRLTITLGAIFAASLTTSILVTRSSPPYAYYGLHTRAWELAAGGLLALGAHELHRITSGVRTAAGWIGLAAIVYSAVTYGAGTAFPGYAALLPVLGAILVIAAGTGRVSSASRALSRPAMTYVGRISYSWYLWHWPCLLFVGALTTTHTSLHDSNTFTIATGWWAVVAVLVSFVLSMASYPLVERPTRNARSLSFPIGSLSVGAAAMGVVIVVATLALPLSSGAPSGPVTAYVDPLGHGIISPASVGSRPPISQVTLALPPASARVDSPHNSRDCYTGYPSPNVPTDCLFGDPHGRKTVALIGDSHADQWFPALDEAAKTHHWRLYLYAKSACPFVELRVRLPQFDNTYPGCPGWRGAVLARLAALPRLDLVVATHYGGIADDSGRYATPSGAPLSFAKLPAAWRVAWRRTDARLSQIAQHVVVLRDTPRPAQDVPACIAKHGTNALPCSFPRANAFTDADRLYDAEQSASTPKTSFVSLDRVLCPFSQCPVVTSRGQIMYRDNQHMSASVSAELGPRLGHRLAMVMSRD